MFDVLIVPGLEDSRNPIEQFKEEATEVFVAKGFKPLVMDSPNYQGDHSSSNSFFDAEFISSYYLKTVGEIINIISPAANSFKIIWFVDWWNPAIPVLQHYLLATGKDIKLAGTAHGTIKAEGEYIQGEMAQHLENSISKCLTLAMLPSDTALKVANLPVPTMSSSAPLSKECMNITSSAERSALVWPHRWSDEKGTAFAKEVFKSLDEVGITVLLLDPYSKVKELYPDRPKNVTLLKPKNKSLYANILSLGFATFSASVTESMGIAMLEGAKCGATPIAPSSEHFQSLLPSTCLYTPNDVDSAVDAVLRAARASRKGPFDYSSINILSYKDRVGEAIDCLTSE